MSNVVSFPHTQLEADKAFDTLRARSALLGAALYRRVALDGAVTFTIGMRRFATLDQVEDELDCIQGEL